MLGLLLALSTLTLFLGFYMNHNKEAKSLSFRKGSEVSQVCILFKLLNQNAIMLVFLMPIIAVTIIITTIIIISTIFAISI